MTLQVCIGYDHREAIAYHVLAHSIMRRASKPVRIQPIMLSQLTGIHRRKRSPMQSTDFTYARFLTPYLADENQLSIFMDCDQLCLADIWEMVDECQGAHDAWVVKHDYTPKTESKFLDQPQTIYPCKNWSSVVVFNGQRMPVKRLTPEYIDSASGMDLHQFKWAESVGELDTCWNHLVGEYEPNPNAKIVHYTLGGPYFQGYETCEYSKEWFDELRDMQNRSNPSFNLVREWI